MAAAHERHERELDLVMLAKNDPLDVLDYAVDLRRESFLHRASYPFVEFARPLREVWELSTEQRRNTLSSYTG